MSEDSRMTFRVAGGNGMQSKGRTGGFSIFRNPPCVWPESMSGQPGAPVRVHVIDSDPHLRGVVAQELMGDTRTVVSGQAGSLRDGRRLLRDEPCDVLLVDMHLEDGLGLELISQARALRPPAEVVVLSRLDSDDDAMRAFDLGAAGFVVKDSWFVSFVQAVLQVANGGASVTPSVSRRLLLQLGRGRAATELGLSPGQVVRIKLSERELEVLKMIASGLTSVEIGQRLAISCTTVNSHVKNMYQKLHVKSRAQAVSCASSWGLI
ncbi:MULTISPECIES: LuxR C-terminal-related transcriptional regulator [Ramlibacter]|nr:MULTISPECIES: response regulator transcription factor [Ramlibacter]